MPIIDRPELSLQVELSGQGLGGKGLKSAQSRTGCGGYLFANTGQRMKVELLVRT